MPPEHFRPLSFAAGLQRLWLIGTLALMLALSQPVLAQSGQAGAGADKVTMNMRDADIRALIQWVADNTGKNIIVHREVEGKVTVLSSQPVTVDEAYQVFLSVLQIHGYAAIEAEGALKVVPKSLAASNALPAAGGSGTADMVVSVLRIQNASAEKIAELLRPMLSPEALVSPYPDTNSLVIADHAVNIESARNLVNQLDRAGDDHIELIPLDYANASDVLESLSALMPQNTGSGYDLTMSVDERSNSIMLAGDPVKRKQVRNLIRKLDAPLEGQGNTQVVYLHYVDAEELVPILKSLSESIQDNQKNESGGSKISIESSESSNALVINAPPAMLTTMRRVISQLDIRRAQVLVEALVVEVSGDVADDVGVTWLTDPEKESIAAVNTLGDLPLVSNTPLNEDSDIPFSPGRGFTFGYFDGDDLQAAVRALNASQNANILSTPTVVAIDNEEASLLVGQNVPFKTGQATSASSTTDNPFTTIERQDIGISLVVTPRINQGDAITLEIQQKTENLAPSVETSAVASDIITNKREIITKALIKDNQILVLGGLISDEETEVREKVPFLGDIPLIGRLFSSTGKSHRKNNLMVFIHPQILKDEEHMRSVTQKRYDFMKTLHDQAQKRELDPNKRTGLDEFETYGPEQDAAPAPVD